MIGKFVMDGEAFMGWYLADLAEVTQIAERDGFEDIVDFFNWFRNMYGDKLYEMEFMVIRWRLK